ncbi:SET domain-containing protein SmydA-8 [Hyalella azteca]|uniref:SET domain-containing protein SmydA-8 n=1 Tax=Hyalella azteca TaxID=294128 RepID=A0A8B7PES0_HYAAZ|nr:SET domain-containing protein SmydA-8 [Hyalella azteca]
METVEAPYRIDVTAEAGRSLVSTRNLPPGYLLLQEGPAVLGPTALSEPVCLACHSPTSLLFRCPGCQWPMCSQTCADHPTHADECSVLAQDTKGVGIPVNTDATPRYDLILILRFLLLRKKDPDMWEKLMALESHWQKRKAENEPHHSAAVQYFLKVCPMEHEENILHRVRGVIMTNCISSKTLSGVSLRGLYPTISLLNHSCKPSVYLRSDKANHLFVHSTVEISEGESLLFSYIATGDPYWKRQRELSDTYYFKCRCERCIDRTEMNIHFSFLRCEKCENGYVDPLFNKKKSYKCTTCKYSTQQAKVMHTCVSIQALYGKADQVHDCRTAMQLLKLVHSKSHGNHYTWLACAGHVIKSLAQNSSINALRLKKQLWMRIIDIYSVIEPGMTRRRGISLLHLGAVSLQLAMLDCNVGRISRPVMLRQLAACRGTLDEARAILRLEPPDTTEEKWIMMEEKERRRLDEIMEQTQELIDEEYGTAQMRRSEEDNLSLEIGDFEDTSVKKVDEYEESCTR